MIPIIAGNDFITMVFSDGSTETIYKTHPNYKRIIEAVKKAEPEDVIKSLVDTTAAVKTYLGNEFALVDGQIMHNGVIMHNTLTQRVLQMMSEGFEITHMLKFMTNLHNNPSKRAVDELYSFMEVNHMPITDDGCILAYKSVREDYKDIHSGKFDNSVGQVVSMPRNQVCDDKNKTCSTGLHFASRSYAETFGGSSSRLMVLKINPADVVSIPTDYNNTKGRCCKYEIIAEVPRIVGAKDKRFASAVYTDSDVSDSDDDANYCPYCGDKVSTTDVYCPHCGRLLD